MFAGVAATEQDMLKELEDNNANATTVVTQAQEKAASMQAQQRDALKSIAKIPAAVGGWGVVWLAGVYWFILRPLLK